ncbi:hypothetical protein AC622_07400 [Bacillus sp. FJAT-27916]|uniref:YqkE family protein n=1 Tax=Bacillaceae TaxID=186817 RepID=UPI000671354F|nr:YqkE family protein [Bacillus sp. FJAT-27916]KMY44100.1 hypothetical protein AC622_07400 [Bacillus sp. FJAT-27916]
MARKKQSQRKPAAKQEDTSLHLGDLLNDDVLGKLRQKKGEWEEAEKKRQEEAERQKREERKRREKNKSFEELLNESDLNWKKFKG